MRRSFSTKPLRLSRPLLADQIWSGPSRAYYPKLLPVHTARRPKLLELLRIAMFQPSLAGRACRLGGSAQFLRQKVTVRRNCMVSKKLSRFLEFRDWDLLHRSKGREGRRCGEEDQYRPKKPCRGQS